MKIAAVTIRCRVRTREVGQKSKSGLAQKFGGFDGEKFLHQNKHPT